MIKPNRPSSDHNFRYESFGGIIRLNKPEALVWVDRDYMTGLGYEPSPLWNSDTDLLSAPTEVHLQPTNRCGAHCRACYTDADGPDIRQQDELPLIQLKKIIDQLVEMRVFHIALGGGESLGMDSFFDLADYARTKCLTPSLTTNGFDMTPEIARRCRVFAAVHVSIDGVRDVYQHVRGYDGFDKAARAVRMLRKSGCKVGLNTVLCRNSIDRLDELVAFAAKAGVKQIEMLRFKPAGRAKTLFGEMKPTREQLDKLFPNLIRLMKKYKVRLLVDCSLAPMIYIHRPDAKKMDLFGVTGCLGGNMLMSVSPDGRPAPCSFAPSEERDVFQASSWWREENTFSLFRNWNENAPEPCRSCEYIKLCHGGCHVVAAHECDDPSQPDPDCLFVRRFRGES